MGSILSKIFGTGDVVDKGMKLLDDAFYTDSEKAEDRLKAGQEKAKQKIALMKAYQPFKIAQRYIAFAFTAVFIFILVNGVVASLYGIVDMESVQAARKFADEMWLGQIMLMIIGFYFSGGVIDSMNRKGR